MLGSGLVPHAGERSTTDRREPRASPPWKSPVEDVRLELFEPRTSEPIEVRRRRLICSVVRRSARFSGRGRSSRNREESKSSGGKKAVPSRRWVHHLLAGSGLICNVASRTETPSELTQHRFKSTFAWRGRTAGRLQSNGPRVVGTNPSGGGRCLEMRGTDFTGVSGNERLRH